MCAGVGQTSAVAERGITYLNDTGDSHHVAPRLTAGASVFRFPYLTEFNDTRFRFGARNDD